MPGKKNGCILGKKAQGEARGRDGVDPEQVQKNRPKGFPRGKGPKEPQSRKGEWRRYVRTEQGIPTPFPKGFGGVWRTKVRGYLRKSPSAGWSGRLQIPNKFITRGRQTKYRKQPTNIQQRSSAELRRDIFICWWFVPKLVTSQIVCQCLLVVCQYILQASNCSNTTWACHKLSTNK